MLTEMTGSCCACLHYNASLTMPTYSSLDFLLFYYSSSNIVSKTLALIPALGHDRHMFSSCVLGFKNFYSSPSSHISRLKLIKWQNGILPNVYFSLKQRQLFKECCYTSHISPQRTSTYNYSICDYITSNTGKISSPTF